MIKRTLSILVFILLLSSCLPGQKNPSSQEGGVAPNEASLDPPSLEVQAQTALTDFYDALTQGRYEQAALLYGGSYEELEYFNPTIDPDNKADLTRAACELNGFVCLSAYEISLVHAGEPPSFKYEVSFANPDGSLFVLGPCCGASEEDMPPVSVFSVEVTCNQDGICQVLNFPPYVP